VSARERESGLGDHIDAVAGIGATRPALAWPLTISMLGLAGLPGTAGFLGKFFLIEAAVDGDFTWLGVVIVVGSMVSLVYYLRVIAAVWMQERPAGDTLPALAGGAPEADTAHPVLSGRGIAIAAPTAIAVLAGAATIVFGILPGPLLDLASDAGAALL